ncbi:hypothetical protein [Nitratidesulfovibrio oxamicus]|nr:hypothetical protein [Nitratidesulfovibrio oxamicus]
MTEDWRQRFNAAALFKLKQYASEALRQKNRLYIIGAVTFKN